MNQKLCKCKKPTFKQVRQRVNAGGIMVPMVFYQCKKCGGWGNPKKK